MTQEDSVKKFWDDCFFEAAKAIKNEEHVHYVHDEDRVHYVHYMEVGDAVKLISNNLKDICSINEIYELIDKLKASCIIKNLKKYTDALRILRLLISRWDCIKSKVTASTVLEIDRDLIKTAIENMLGIKNSLRQNGGASRTKPSMIIDNPYLANNSKDTYKLGDKVFFIKQRKSNNEINLYLGIVTGWEVFLGHSIHCTFESGFNVMDLDTIDRLVEDNSDIDDLVNNKDFPKSLIKVKSNPNYPKGIYSVEGDITLVPVEDEHLPKINRAIKSCVKGNE